MRCDVEESRTPQDGEGQSVPHSACQALEIRKAGAEQTAVRVGLGLERFSAVVITIALVSNKE